jgi:hypothetical protein
MDSKRSLVFTDEHGPILDCGLLDERSIVTAEDGANIQGP